MTTSQTLPTKLERPDHLELCGAATTCRWPIRVALCALSLLAATPANIWAQNLYAWGSDYFDLVSGTPTTGYYLTVAAGGIHNLAIRSDLTLVSWGDDNAYQVSDTPAGTFATIAAGDFHSVAIRTNGTLVAWGGSHNSQLLGVPTGTFFAIGAGYRHSVAIRTDGTLVTWGFLAPSDVLLSDTPEGIFNAVACGQRHSVAIRRDGTLVSWGDDDFGQVSGTPAGTFLGVAAGRFTSVAIRADGTLVAWGEDKFGQVSGTPSGTFTQVAVGDTHCIALRTDRTLVSWGDDHFGQVSGTPSGGTYFVVSAGRDHSVVDGQRQLTPAEQIAALSVSVQELVDTGVSLPAAGQPLQTKLDAAATALEEDDIPTAIGSLGAFINQTEAYVRTKKLTPTQGQTLIDGAELIITDLGS